MSLEMWSQVKQFRDGDELNAETLNVPITQLGERTSYLYSRLRTLLDGGMLSSVILTDVELSTAEGEEPDVGNAVYLANDSHSFALAKATMSLYDDFTAADSAFTVGILVYKDGTHGNVLVYGRMNLDPNGSPIDAAAMIESGEEFRPGRYYLSCREAGRLTADPNGPRIYVCTIDGTMNDRTGAFDAGTAIVSPQFLDIGTSHVHRTAVLTARPAGALSEDGKHVLGYPTVDPSGPFHLIFGGTWTKDSPASYVFSVKVNETAPSGFSLGWKEGAATDWEWRPVVRLNGDPIEITNGLTARLICHGMASGLSDSMKEWPSLLFPFAGRGWIDHVPMSYPSGDSSSGSGDPYDEEPGAKYEYVIGMDPQIANYWPPVPPKSAALVVNGVEMDNKALFPDRPTVAFGLKTLYWFEDDAGRRPWPDAFESRDAYIDPALDKAEIMHWVRGFQGATGPVTSIQAKPGSPIKIYGYGTEDYANTGDLEIDASLDFEMVGDGAPGYMVPKRSERGKLIAGPVVERVRGGAGVNIISSAGQPRGQGTVIVALDDGSYRSQFADIALENAEQAKIGMFPYVRLKGYTGSTIAHPSAFTAMMRVPTSVPDGKYALKVQASVFGEAGFGPGASKQTAFVNLSYNILPDYNAESGLGYSNLKTGLLKPDVERVVKIPFGHTSGEGIVYNGFDPVLVMTDTDDDVEDKDDVVEKVLGGLIPMESEFALQSAVVPELRPGYLVGIRISRAVAQGSGITPYTGALGFINLSWSLVSAD